MISDRVKFNLYVALAVLGVFLAVSGVIQCMAGEREWFVPLTYAVVTVVWVVLACRQWKSLKGK